MRPGDPWECGRCCSEGSRAVLADDGRPGCHICRHISGTDLLGLVIKGAYRRAYREFAGTFVSPFLEKLELKPVRDRRGMTFPVVLS